VRAVQYVRMSTEHQRYSTANQAHVILQYAESNGMVIVRTYEDAGKSGLSLHSPPGVAAAYPGRMVETELLTINDEFTVSFFLVRCRETKRRGFRWQFALPPARGRADITVEGQVTATRPMNDSVDSFGAR
jgi:hypothetical protein